MPITFLDRVTLVTRWGAQIGLWVLSFLVINEVFMRYVLNRPTHWGVDYASLLSVVTASLGLAYVTKVKGHIAVTLFTGHLSEKGKNVCGFFTNIVGVLLCSVLVWQMLEFCLRAFRMNNISEDTGMPLWPYILIFSTCIGLMGFQFLAKIFESARIAWGTQETTQ
ncbi:TRAP transporter small permease [Chloroflexota bacterium]